MLFGNYNTSIIGSQVPRSKKNIGDSSCFGAGETRLQRYLLFSQQPEANALPPPVRILYRDPLRVGAEKTRLLDL